MHNNKTKSLLDQDQTSEYGSIISPAKNKLTMAGISGKVDNREVCLPSIVSNPKGPIPQKGPKMDLGSG